jgi:signal transduction histidine kinase
MISKSIPACIRSKPSARNKRFHIFQGVAKMFLQLSLRRRILLLIASLAIINVSGSAITLWYAYKTQNLNHSMVNKDLAALIAAQNLETALVMQKGFLTYYFMTDSPEWLEKLKKHHEDFQIWLIQAREINQSTQGVKILNEIESRYIRFVFDREKIIELYTSGEKKEGASKHWNVRNQFFKIHELTGQFKKIQEDKINDSSQSLRSLSLKIKYIAVAAIPFVMLLSIFLTMILFSHVLNPIHKLALEADLKEIPGGLENEIEALKNRVHHLIMDIGQTHAKLEESQEHLVQSERLAMVGKLAAGVAHSVRNPLTSVKMRLFTLERSLTLTLEQKEDLDVISEEIRHIDTILRNFLEYARPPKLNCQLHSPSDVVDLTIQLLKHRIESYRVDINVERRQKLPKVMLDSDQLKEVLVNLIINSCEAMGENGKITIIEEKIQNDPYHQTAVIRVKDNGPGISPELKEKIFEPFFSSKEEGSGLGLSIAKRIMKEHGGELQAEFDEEPGATFTIIMPIKEYENGDNPDR